MSEIYVIKELPEGIFAITFEIIDWYKLENSILELTPKCYNYKIDSFNVDRETIKFVTYNDNIAPT